MISALSKGILQLFEPSTRRMVWITLGASALIFLILLTLIEIGFQYTAVFQVNWMETVSDTLGRLLTLALTWLLFPAIISAVMSLFLDRIANAVEARHYRNLSAVSAPPLFESITVAIKFLIVLISLNIVLLFFMTVCVVSLSV